MIDRLIFFFDIFIVFYVIASRGEVGRIAERILTTGIQNNVSPLIIWPKPFYVLHDEITWMETDLHSPSNIILSTRTSLALLSLGNRSYTEITSLQSTNQIHSFSQLDNETILIVNGEIHCIRQFNQTSRKIKLLRRPCGQCTNRKSLIVSDRNGKTSYITRGALILRYETRQSLEILAVGNNTIYTAMILNTESTKLYLFTSKGYLSTLNVETKSFTHLSTDVKGISPSQMAFVGKGALVMVDYHENEIRVVYTDGMVRPLCTGNGSAVKCYRVKRPSGVVYLPSPSTFIVSSKWKLYQLHVERRRWPREINEQRYSKDIQPTTSNSVISTKTAIQLSKTGFDALNYTIVVTAIFSTFATIFIVYRGFQANPINPNVKQIVKALSIQTNTYQPASKNSVLKKLYAKNSLTLITERAKSRRQRSMKKSKEPNQLSNTPPAQSKLSDAPSHGRKLFAKIESKLRGKPEKKISPIALKSTTSMKDSKKPDVGTEKKHADVGNKFLLKEDINSLKNPLADFPTKRNGKKKQHRKIVKSRSFAADTSMLTYPEK